MGREEREGRERRRCDSPSVRLLTSEAKTWKADLTCEGLAAESRVHWRMEERKEERSSSMSST